MASKFVREICILTTAILAVVSVVQSYTFLVQDGRHSECEWTLCSKEPQCPAGTVLNTYMHYGRRALAFYVTYRQVFSWVRCPSGTFMFCCSVQATGTKNLGMNDKEKTQLIAVRPNFGS